ARDELHESHAALDQPPGDQAAGAEIAGDVVIEAVEAVRVGGLAANVDGLRCGRLHLEGQLVGGNAGVQYARRRGCLFGVTAVKRLRQVQHLPLPLLADAFRPVDVKDRRALRLERRALVDRRQETVAPKRGATLDLA